MTDPQSLLSRDRVAGIVLMIVAVAIAWESRALPLGTLYRPGAAYMPLVTSGALGLIGALIALRGGGPPLRALAWPEARHAAFLLAACAFAGWALERLGYRLTILFMVVFFLGLLERRPPILAVSVALALSLGSYYLFANLLRVPLPLGPWNF